MTKPFKRRTVLLASAALLAAADVAAAQTPGAVAADVQELVVTGARLQNRKAVAERRGTPRVRDWRVPTGATPLWLRAWAIRPCGSTRRSRSCLDARRGWGGRAQ